MKRYVNYYSIKFILIAAIVVLPVVFIIILRYTWSEAISDCYPTIVYENAPENTAYVDILVKLPESSADYVDFAKWEEPPQIIIGYQDITEAVDVANGRYEERTRTLPIYEELTITPNSEIAKLCDDGFVSLSIHYRNSKGFFKTGIQLDDAITDINERFGKFKAAYVDSSGNVLKITDISRTRFDPKQPSGFILNGDSLIFTKHSMSPLQYILLAVSFYGELLAMIALVVCTVLDRRQNKYLKTHTSSD